MCAGFKDAKRFPYSLFGLFQVLKYGGAEDGIAGRTSQAGVVCGSHDIDRPESMGGPRVIDTDVAIDKCAKKGNVRLLSASYIGQGAIKVIRRYPVQGTNCD